MHGVDREKYRCYQKYLTLRGYDISTHDNDPKHS